MTAAAYLNAAAYNRRAAYALTGSVKPSQSLDRGLCILAARQSVAAARAKRTGVKISAAVACRELRVCRVCGGRGEC